MIQGNSKTFLIISFIVLTILTTVFVLMANVGIFGEEVRKGEFAKWGMGAVLAEIVGVTVIAFRQSISSSVNPVANVKLPEDVDEDDIEMAPENCTYTITKGNKEFSGKIRPLVKAPGEGWDCTIPTTISSSNDLITLQLVDTEGKKWRVGGFFPYHSKQKAKLVRLP